MDPRIKGVAVEIGPVAAGWAKVQEIRRWVLEVQAGRGRRRFAVACGCRGLQVGAAKEFGAVAAGWARGQEIRRWVQEMQQWGVGAVQHRHWRACSVL